MVNHIIVNSTEEEEQQQQQRMKRKQLAVDQETMEKSLCSGGMATIATQLLQQQTTTTTSSTPSSDNNNKYNSDDDDSCAFQPTLPIRRGISQHVGQSEEKTELTTTLSKQQQLGQINNKKMDTKHIQNNTTSTTTTTSLSSTLVGKQTQKQIEEKKEEEGVSLEGKSNEKMNKLTTMPSIGNDNNDEKATTSKSSRTAVPGAFAGGGNRSCEKMPMSTVASSQPGAFHVETVGNHLASDRLTLAPAVASLPTYQVDEKQQFRDNVSGKGTMEHAFNNRMDIECPHQKNEPSEKNGTNKGSSCHPGTFRMDDGETNLALAPGLAPPITNQAASSSLQEQKGGKSAVTASDESFKKQVGDIELSDQAFLLEATLVSEDVDDKKETSDHPIVMADPFVESDEPRKRQRRLILLSLCLVVTLIGVILGLTLGNSGKTTLPILSPSETTTYPLFNISRDEPVAIVPKTICYERNPGAGESDFCNVNDTISQGGGVANLVAQAFLDYVTDADIAILNSGACRRDIVEGNFTRRDAEALLPFSNRLVTLEMTGQQLIDSLEEGLAYFLSGEQPDAEYTLTGAYPYAAGLRYDVNMTVPDGKNFLSNVEVNIRLQQETWLPLQMNQIYSVAANSFLAEGGDEYSILGRISQDQSPLDETELEESQIFLLYANKLGILTDPLLDQYSTKSYIAP